MGREDLTRNLIFALPRVTINGCAEGQTLLECHEAFRPHYLIIPRDVAPDFTVTAILISKKSQLPPGTDGVSATYFSGDVETREVLGSGVDIILKKVNLDVPLPLALDECRPGDVVVVRARNVNPCARNFHCAFYGPAVKPGEDA